MAKKLKIKKQRMLENDEVTLNRIKALSQLMCTQHEAAAVLGVNPRTFEFFLARNPEVKDAWFDGKHEARASLKRLLWKQAQTDSSQARFLARQKEWLNMNDDKISAHVEVNVNNAMTTEDRLAMIEALQGKVINGKASEVEDAEVVETPRAIDRLIVKG